MEMMRQEREKKKGSGFSKNRIVQIGGDLAAVGRGHDGEAGGARTEILPPPLLVGGRTDKGGECAPNPLALDGPDPNQRVRHRGSAGVEAIRRRGRRRRRAVVREAEALVEAAAEGAGVGGGGAHAGAANGGRPEFDASEGAAGGA